MTADGGGQAWLYSTIDAWATHIDEYNEPYWQQGHVVLALGPCYRYTQVAVICQNALTQRILGVGEAATPQLQRRCRRSALQG